MIKLTFCLRRRPDLSPKEFAHHWSHVHAALVRRHAHALGILRYVQSHPLDSALDSGMKRSPDAPDRFDGVAEIWLESEQAIRDAMATEEGKVAGRELRADEERFIDFRSSPIWLTAEHEIL